MRQRRQRLASFCDVYVCVEGGRGTQHETTMVRQRGAPIIPVAKYGGYAKMLFAELACPTWADPYVWNSLADSERNPETIGAAVVHLLGSLKNTRAFGR